MKKFEIGDKVFVLLNIEVNILESIGEGQIGWVQYLSNNTEDLYYVKLGDGPKDLQCLFGDEIALLPETL